MNFPDGLIFEEDKIALCWSQGAAHPTKLRPNCSETLLEVTGPHPRDWASLSQPLYLLILNSRAW